METGQLAQDTDNLPTISKSLGLPSSRNPAFVFLWDYQNIGIAQIFSVIPQLLNGALHENAGERFAVNVHRSDHCCFAFNYPTLLSSSLSPLPRLPRRLQASPLRRFADLAVLDPVHQAPALEVNRLVGRHCDYHRPSRLRRRKRGPQRDHAAYRAAVHVTLDIE